ncbi:MAG TPA: DISARM system SNF2-like helicase DrmD, partial [Polyangiaceae bacterium]|nr:DISARM system SNF2-like helicase DrmD [Polyangiaceae bacterium]
MIICALPTVAISLESVLDALPKGRLIELGRHFSVGLNAAGTRETLVKGLTKSGQLRLRTLVEWMGRDELRRACENHGLPANERARTALAATLLNASKTKDSLRPAGLFGALPFDRHAPKVGDIVRVRQRQYLVEEVTPPPEPDHATRVELVCLDDDNQGRSLEVLWELELGAKVEQPHLEGLGKITGLDPPRHFAAYLHALRWNSVTATDTRLFQAPFRAGIKLMSHQLIPLKKALELPRANLFIADDVGLGKTIEAGLVLQELELRQRIDFVLIVCPASICLQWRREMEKRFGQHFEIYDREFVAVRRKERGFGVRAWGTHNRFIISYQTMRRVEYFEPLIQHLGGRLKKSLLVLDEAHTAAPASSSKYAIDSRITGVVRDLAPRFENRLFLSATPHNGHSNSFSALMEILDPQRFTRGVKVHAETGALKQVMVRRLKRDLRKANMGGSFPERKVIPVSLSEGPREELRLAEMLAEYTTLMRPKKGRGQLVFINLQKRLLSSVEAFHRTLQVHAERVEAGGLGKDAQLDLSEENRLGSLLDEATTDADEDAVDREADQTVRDATQSLQSPGARARELLTEMLSLANKLRGKPDAKALALIDWVNKNQCPAVSPNGAKGSGTELKWQQRRLLIFTEYADTKRYLTNVLQAAVEGSHLDEERIEGFHGAMSDEQRESVQRHFNGDPAVYPVRILIATDAAREGLNLQNHCADLFHFDIPWNPARLEQRNGRIDRTLQPQPKVQCYYFVYPDRPEDAVLKKLVEKVDTIQAELGSLGDVVMQRIERALAKGIDGGSSKDLDDVDPSDDAKSAVNSELEGERADIKRLQSEVEEADKIWEASKKVIDFNPSRPEPLRDAVNVGLELAGAGPLKAIKVPDIQDQIVYELPSLPESWTQTLDTLRPARERGEEPWNWRKKPPQPVVFQPLDRMGEERVHLHLEHPFVQRILSRFRSQGYSAQDLSRVTVLANPNDAAARVIALGRISLFGPGAARLHDEVVSVTAQWLDSKGKGHLRPFGDDTDRRALETLEQLLHDTSKLADVPKSIQTKLCESAAEDFASLWKAVKDE